MRIGIVVDGRRSAGEIAELARLADAHGIAHFWLSGGSRTKDHFLRLALAASSTTRIQLGPVAVSPFEMHPARIGIALLTLHEIAGGRSTMVLGGGGDFAATLGVPLTRRVTAVADSLGIIRALAHGGEVNYRGGMFRVSGLFTPWALAQAPPIYIGANRPRMLRLAAEKGDGVMFTDMPLRYVSALVGQVRRGLQEAGRDERGFSISNWFVWNVQETMEEAWRFARRNIGFRLYYIRDIAASIGLSDADAVDLERKQQMMLRAMFQGKEPEAPAKPVMDLLVEHLTITGDYRGLEGCIDRLRAFERQGLNEIALALHGEPSTAIRLLGEKVIPFVQ